MRPFSHSCSGLQVANLRCRSISEIVLTDAEFFAARATHPVVWRLLLDGSRSCRHVNCLEPLTAVEHEVEFLSGHH